MRDRRSWMRRLAVAVLVTLAAIPSRAPAADAPPLVPAPLLQRIRAVALDLAKRGRKAESAALVDVAHLLNAPAADVASMKDATAKAAAKAKVAPLPLPDLSKSLAKLAAEVAATLPTHADEAKLVVARQVLRIDASLAAAHEALGETRRDGVWIPAGYGPVVARRGAIQEAVRAARRIDVPVTTSVGSHPLLVAVHGREGVMVSAEEITIESATVDPVRLARQLRLAVQATHLTNWLSSGTLAPARRTGPYKTIVFNRKADYVKAVDEAERQGLLDAANAKWARENNGTTLLRLRLMFSAGESHIGMWSAFDTMACQVFEKGQAIYHGPVPLVAGLFNWVCLNFLGCPMPRLVWIETTEGEGRSGATSDTPLESAERKEMLRMAKAGIAGLRGYLRWLARRDEDPAWSRSMVDEIGKVSGPDLAKCTFVAEYLFETGEFEKLAHAAYGGGPGPAPFEKALGGESLASFERRWRAWFLAGDAVRGLVQTLGAAEGSSVSPAERDCVAYLAALRRRTLGKDSIAPDIDEELSKGCRLHALYLGLNPQQAQAWPDAHEEYPDKEGFSPEGARAGLASVIMPAAKGHADSIDGWMATFYHRLPLIVPGVLRIGWAREKGFGVLDAVSLAAPPEFTTSVLWPPSGAVDVPRRFVPELPHPVPGEDQSAWGYPVTLQFFKTETVPDVVMHLHLGRDRKGPEVPCHFSSPSKPTNPQLAPVDAFCLIPKTTLAPGTTYTVAVDGWPADVKGADWQFTTGK